MINPYEDYFSQSGNGLKVFVGSPHQRGHGIGSFLGGLFRSVLPLLKSGARAIGREALRTGVNIASDIATHKTPFRESFEHRFKESADNLKRKANEKINTLMEGSGYNIKKKRKKRHSSTKQRRKSTKKPKKVKRKSKKQRKKKKTKKRTVEDIFS